MIYNSTMRYILILLIALAGCSQQDLITALDTARSAGVTAIAKVTPNHGTTLTTFRFDGNDSFDSNGSPIAIHAWKWGDGTNGAFTSTATHRFAEPGTYEVKLTVVSKREVWAFDYLTIVVADPDTEHDPGTEVNGWK